MTDNNGFLTTADLTKLGTIPLFPAKPDIPRPQMYFDEKNTVQYKIKEQTEQLSKNQQEQIEILKKQLQKSEKQIELLEKNNQENERQIRLLNEQVEQLMINHNTLSNLYNAKVTELEEAKKDAKKSGRFNWTALIISIISLLVAIGAWVFPR